MFTNFRIEFQNDPENKIARPRQLYKGKLNESYIEVGERPEVNINLNIQKTSELDATESMFYKRRKVKQ